MSLCGSLNQLAQLDMTRLQDWLSKTMAITPTSVSTIMCQLAVYQEVSTAEMLVVDDLKFYMNMTLPNALVLTCHKARFSLAPLKFLYYVVLYC